MPTREPANRETNGAGPTPRVPGGRMVGRRVAIGAVILFVAAWTAALIYSVTAGGRSPERLDDPTAQAVETACHVAQHELSALTQVGSHPTVQERATRIAKEDQVLTAMVDQIRGLRPGKKTPATALNAWLDDWERLIAARQHFATDLGTSGTAARFIEPATKGIKPIADKMNDWILEQGTRTDNCNTGALQAEVVEGPRTYGSVSKS